MPIPTESWLPILFNAALRPGMRSQAYPQYAAQQNQQHSKTSSTLTSCA